VTGEIDVIPIACEKQKVYSISFHQFPGFPDPVLVFLGWKPHTLPWHTPPPSSLVSSSILRISVLESRLSSAPVI
jgi:hypothetical protein